ncbi:MAG TPA: T9SS type A sorting domain-containing protein [Bacteroidales bacterium]|nr:T9SS type A sorting domain-containing protein [Bacteroidales bacterium]
MKKIISFILGILLFSPLYAQIPNGGFEAWSNDSTPVVWNGVINIDIYIQTYQFYTAAKTADVHSGESAVVVSTNKYTPYVDILLPGIMSYGTTNLILSLIDFSLITNTTGGIPVNIIPQKVKGYYMYEGVNDDSMSVSAECYYNSILVGSGGLTTNVPQLEYIPFEFDLTYTENDVTPDLFNIIFQSSSSSDPQYGSALYLDDISIEYTLAGITETVSIDELVTMYPNPSRGMLHIGLTPDEMNIIKVYDSYGKQVFSSACDQKFTMLDMSSFANGAYLVEVINSSGHHLKKFILAR